MTARQYGPQPTRIACTPTKAEHDERVAETGRPYTQPDWDRLPHGRPTPIDN